MNKIEKAILSYSVSEANKSYCGGKGGNALFLFFMLSRAQEMSNTVEKVATTDSAVVWNNNWLETASMPDVRTELDGILATATANWKSPLTAEGKVDSAAFTDKVNAIDANAFLESTAQIDYSTLSNLEKAFVSAKITNHFSSIIDSNKEKAITMVPALLSMYESVGLAVATFSIRTGITLSRILDSGIDELPGFDALLKSFNTSIDS